MQEKLEGYYTEEIKQLFNIMIEQILKIKIGEEKAKEFKKNIKNEEVGDVKVMTVFDTIRQDNKLIFNNGIKTGVKTGTSPQEINKIKSE